MRRRASNIVSPARPAADRSASEAPVHVPGIFGPHGYAVLPRSELLSAVLVDVLRGLIGM